jgi:hypothetical protein
MAYEGILKKSVDTIAWQDYRASNTGMLVFYSTDPVSEMAIREVPEDASLPFSPDPHYETGTYGFYGCFKSKQRSSFAKSKSRYMFFMTKYTGTLEAFRDKLMVTGFYRVAKTADVQKIHIRYLSEYSCVDADSCTALRADEVHFVSLDNALIITDEVLKSWNYASKITKQTKIMLEVDKTEELLAYLRNKPNVRDQYIAETKRLLPHELLEEAEEPEEETVPAE